MHRIGIVASLTLSGVAVAAPQTGSWSTNFAPNALGVNGPVWSLHVFDADAGGPIAPVLVAGGNFTNAGGVGAVNIAEFDGVAWSALGGGVQGLAHALAVFDEPGAAPPALFVAGQFATAGGSTSAVNIARWNGTAWSALSTGVTGANVSVTSMVAFDPDGAGPQPAELVVAGQDIFGGSIAKWDGQSWSQLGSGVNSDIHALAVFDEPGAAPPALFASGGFVTAGGLSASHIARWDGTAWSDVGGGASGDVTALTTFDPDGAGPRASVLAVAGNFTTVAGGTVSASHVAIWDGVSWSALGAGVNSGLYFALASFDRDGAGPNSPMLVVGGDFSMAGTGGASNIAGWDDASQSWSAIGSGTNNRVRALLAVDPGSVAPSPTLFAGGDFTTAGGVPSNHLGAWSECGTWSTFCTAGTTVHGCVPWISASGTPSSSSPSGFNILVNSVEGQRNGLLFYGSYQMSNPPPWAPNSTSFLCIASPTQRMTLLNSGGTAGQCNGVLQLDFNAWITANPWALGSPFTPLQVFHVQGWFRDPAAPKGTNLSNALTFRLCN